MWSSGRLTAVSRFTPRTHMPCVMTFNNNAASAEGIINWRHWIRLPLTVDPTSGMDRKLLACIGSPAGVGSANRLMGVDRAKADHVAVRVGYMGMKKGRLRKCYCQISRLLSDVWVYSFSEESGTYAVEEPFTPSFAV